jgi:MFS family permease
VNIVETIDGAPTARSGSAIEGGHRIGFVGLLVLLIVAETVCSFESSMIYVVLAEVYRATGDPVHAGWLLTAFTLTAAAASAICSRLGDIYGRKRVLVVMLAVALSGSTISALAHDLNVVIVGRALQGASMAILPLAYGLLREHAPIEKVPLGVGMLGGVYTFGSGAGTLIGGVIVDNLQWQGIFYASAGLAVVALVSCGLLLPKSRPHPVAGRVDILGGILFAPAVALILLAFTFLNKSGWYEPQVFGTFLGGMALLALWIWHELRLADPLISVRMLADRRLALPNLGMLFYAIGPQTLPLVFLPLLQQASWSGVGFGISASVAGSVWMGLCFFSAAVVMMSGHVATRRGSRLVVLSALAGMALGFAALALGGYTSLWLVLATFVCFLSPGAAVAYGMIPALIIERSPEARTSEATGLTQVIRSVCMSIGALMVPYVLSTAMISGPGGAELPSPAAYVRLFVVLALAAALAAFCVAKTPSARLKD